MASLKELDEMLPSKYTLSNKNLIIMAHVMDETIYFYDQLGPTTTIILLTQPNCLILKKIFLEFMIDMGTTVIDLRETETFDPDYELSIKSKNVIKSLIRDYNYDYIITHPKYSKYDDSQNRALFDYVSDVLNMFNKNNHYIFNFNYAFNNANKPCGIKDKIIKLYCGLSDEKLYDKYVFITSHIKGIKKSTK